MSDRPVLLVQLPIPPAGPDPVRGNVPLAAAYLALFARRRGHRAEILPSRAASHLGDHALVAELCARRPAVLGFTCYLWNIDRTLWLAQRVRERLPDVRIVLGGPEITVDNDWVLGHEFVDFAVFGEGEVTFTELLDGLRDGADADALARVPGLGCRRGGRLSCNTPRAPMRDLTPTVSPYLHGILDAGEESQLLLETVRGCVFKCKFCYYPKAYDSQFFLAPEHVLALLEHARERAVREVFLLDPTLNQRPDFIPFLELLRRGNPDRSLEFHGELRGEGLTGRHAELMREAGFAEVEIGLQSIDPHTQEQMDRRNNLKAFERGVRALRDQGIRVKVDLIVGLPGDTEDSVRRGMHWVAERGLCDDVQVFQLSILPGTAFRSEAAQRQLEFQARPPYYVLRTPTLELAAMRRLLVEAEELFGVEFDPLPPPSVADGEGMQAPAVVLCDLDSPAAAAAPPAAVAQACCLRLQSRDPYRSLDRAVAVVRAHLAANPFSTLQVVLATEDDFPLDVLDALARAAEPTVAIYLDRYHAFSPGSPPAARRLCVELPAAARDRIDGGWVDAALQLADVVWLEDSASAAAPRPDSRPGEWRAARPRPFRAPS
ncbi:MAG: radical SAM protein [Planctomycetota bacterium]